MILKIKLPIKLNVAPKEHPKVYEYMYTYIPLMYTIYLCMTQNNIIFAFKAVFFVVESVFGRNEGMHAGHIATREYS